jgi:hypothetical protein
MVLVGFAVLSQEVGRPETSIDKPVTSEDLAHFESISARFGYWNASHSEDAQTGLNLSFRLPD